MADKAHIIVGCGGSGILALKRLNQLLSQDYYWRRRLATDVYYVVVDTDLEDIQEFEKSIQRDLAGAPDKPYIVAVQLSKGESLLQPLVMRYMVDPFSDGQNVTGRDRLLQHWWNRGPEKPFFAPNVTPLTKGAGQCPPVSYFLTWKGLEAIEENFKTLIAAIQKRQGGMGGYDVLNFVIVAGLAGGTGRGSWELIAFKMRELFEDYNKLPPPRAFLFDSSVFEDVFKDWPEQRVPMQANALTGISQLSCWISNKREGLEDPSGVVRYNLPGLSNPETPEADVLRVDLKLNVNRAAPVDHAYLICGESGVAILADHFQYCEMVGAGIYAALSKSSIDKQRINSTFPLLGLATAAYEVNAATLQRYFEAQARVQGARMLMTVDEALVDAKVEAFFKKTHLRIDVTDDDPATHFRPDPKGLLLERALARLSDKSGNRLAALRQALERDEVDEVKRLVKGALAKNDDLVRSCLREAAVDLQLDPAAEAETLSKELFESSKSVANVKLFVEKLQAALLGETAEMPAEMAWGRDHPVTLADEFAQRPLPIIYRHFNEGECKKLLEVVGRGIPTANYLALKEELEQAYAGWSRQIDRLRANAADLVGGLLRLEHKFSRERERAVPETDNAFERLFTDPERPEDGLEKRFSARKFYRRELKPVLAKGDEAKLLQDQIELGEELFTTACGALLQPREFSETEAFDVRKRTETRLEKAIRNTVGLRDRFIADRFSIRKVLEGLIRAWRNRLGKKLGFDERSHLEDRFKEFFGFLPRPADDGSEVNYEFPTVDEFVLHMAASLAKTCRPYWMLRHDKERKVNVSLFVPVECSVEHAETTVRNILRDDSIGVSVVQELQSLDAGGDTTANPFILLAYSTEGTLQVENIASLDYYTKSGVFDLLRDAERPDGASIFKGGTNDGIGYIDPLYVRDEKVCKMRWRPWHDISAGDEVDECKSLDALLYALFPGDKPGDRLAKVQTDLLALGWHMPLLEHKGKNRYHFTRLPLECVDGRVRTDTQIQALEGWDAGRPFAQGAGLHNVYEVLHGGEGHKPNWRPRILAESEVFWETLLHGQLSLARGTPEFRNLLYDYQVWLSKKAKACKPEDKSKAVWNKLLERAKTLAGP